jgi:hypothetical protein
MVALTVETWWDWRMTDVGRETRNARNIALRRNQSTLRLDGKLQTRL